MGVVEPPELARVGLVDPHPSCFNDLKKRKKERERKATSVEKSERKQGSLDAAKCDCTKYLRENAHAIRHWSLSRMPIDNQPRRARWVRRRRRGDELRASFNIVFSRLFFFLL
jgi:hypothetical protein